MGQAESPHTAALIERILGLTNSAQSVPFYRKAIKKLGEGVVEEECKRRSENRPRHAVRAGDAAEKK